MFLHLAGGGGGCGGHAWWGVCMVRGVCGWGCMWLGVCVAGGVCMAGGGRVWLGGMCGKGGCAWWFYRSYRSNFLHFHAVFGKKWANNWFTPPLGLASLWQIVDPPLTAKGKLPLLFNPPFSRNWRCKLCIVNLETVNTLLFDISLSG